MFRAEFTVYPFLGRESLPRHVRDAVDAVRAAGTEVDVGLIPQGAGVEGEGHAGRGSRLAAQSAGPRAGVRARLITGAGWPPPGMSPAEVEASYRALVGISGTPPPRGRSRVFASAYRPQPGAACAINAAGHPRPGGGAGMCSPSRKANLARSKRANCRPNQKAGARTRTPSPRWINGP